MKYSWASITKSCTNFGNYQIEYSIKKILSEKGFKTPAFAFDAFKKQPQSTIKKINSTDFLIIPGCTTLNLNHYPGLKSVILKIKIPIYNIGASFFGKPNPDSLKYYDLFFKPIGTRDPASNSFLKSHHIPTELIGCPTLFSGQAKKIEAGQNNNILFIFGLEKIDKQIELYKFIKKKAETKIILQEERQLNFIQKLNAPSIKYSPQNLIKEFKNCRLVVTGRLHGALPALSCGIPVFFIHTINDSRFSLLDFLGVPIHQLDDPQINDKLLKAATIPKDLSYSKIYERIWQLKGRFLDYIEKVKQDHLKRANKI